jgi:hypothetical protein
MSDHRSVSVGLAPFPPHRITRGQSVVEKCPRLRVQEALGRLSVGARLKVARIFTVSGSVVLLASVVLHCLAYLKVSSPAVAASNLAPVLKAVFTVAFLSMAWNWLVLAAFVLVVTFGDTRFRRTVVLICGFAVLLQAAFTVPLVGFFIGNEMIGAASTLIIVGGFLFNGSTAAAPRT